MSAGNKWIWVGAIALALTACGGGGDDDGDAEIEFPALTDDASGDGETAVAEASTEGGGDGGGDGGEVPAPTGDADGTVTVELGTFEVFLVDDCVALGDDGPFGFSARTADGASELGVAGFGNLGTVGFTVDGETHVWAAAAAMVEKTGSVYTWSGETLRTAGGTDTMLSFTVDCG